MLSGLMTLLFPPKCILCRKLLSKQETDLCHKCRAEAPIYTKPKNKPSFLARWTAVWYYKDNPRKSILRYKFGNARSYAGAYGRLLAMKLQTEDLHECDILTWVTTGPRRRWKRGFDHVQSIAESVAEELGIPLTKTLIKMRRTRVQSSLSDSAQRKANVLGAYKVICPETIAGKKILLLDDVLTTGATASECARTLLTAGAKEINFAAVAAAYHDTKK